MTDVLEHRLAERAATLPQARTGQLDALAKELIARGEDVVNLTAGETDFPTMAPAFDAARAALDEGFTRYTASAGIAPLRAAVAAYLRDRHGASYAPDDVVVSNGAKQAVFNALSVLVDPGDEVLFAAPYWVSYPPMVSLLGARPVAVRPGKGFTFPVEHLAEALGPRSRVLVLNSPANPTGVVYERAELAALVRLAVDNGLYVVSDEIYADLVYPGAQFTSVAGLGADVHARTVTVGGVSKTYAMTGWRIGWAAAPPAIAAAMTALQSHTTSAPSSIAQRAALGVLTTDVRDELGRRQQDLDRRRRLLLDGLADVPGFVVDYEPRGAFFVLADVSSLYGSYHGKRRIADAADVADLLLTHAKVAVVPGADFGAPDHVRLSYVVAADRLQETVRRLRDFVDALRPQSRRFP